MKAIMLLFFVCAGLVAPAQIGSKIQQQQSKIAGIWQNNQFGYQMILMLNPDGKGEFDGEAVRYTAKDGKLSLTITAQNQTTVYSYVLNANMLTVSGGDLEQPVAFTKAGTTTTVNAAPVAAAAAISTAGPAVTTASVPVPAQTSTVQTPTSPDQGLLGRWSGNNESMEFRSDGKCIYNGTPVDYQISQGHILLSTQQGTSMMAYTLAGNQLKMTINGAQYTYTKVDDTRQGAGVKGSRSGSANRNVLPELAGKWCKMSSGTGYASSACIILNMDGTYSYSSESSRSVNTDAVSGGTASQGADQGNWWVEGDRIFYNSPTKGQGSYRLEKRNHPVNTSDPMIVLDGEAYVTATLKQPWK
jgi:hypothetical protein